MIFLTACSSLSPLTFSEKRYAGKFYLSQNNKISNFIVRINVFPEDIIIQVSRPFLGNLVKIKFNHNDGISSYPKIDNEYFSLLKSYDNKDYIDFFDSCFRNFDITKNILIIKKNNLELKCNSESNGVLLIYFIYKNEFNINGILKRE